MSIYGIDFGYSKACIATIDANGKPMVIRNNVDASDILESVVYFESADNIIIGTSAKEMAEIDSERAVKFVKKISVSTIL